MHARLIKKRPGPVTFKKHVFASLPEPSGFAAAIPTMYPRMETTKGHAPIEARICSPLSCHRDSGRKSRAPSADTRTVLGIDCRADPVGQTCSALASAHSSMDAEAQQRSAQRVSTFGSMKTVRPHRYEVGLANGERGTGRERGGGMGKSF